VSLVHRRLLAGQRNQVGEVLDEWNAQRQARVAVHAEGWLISILIISFLIQNESMNTKKVEFVMNAIMRKICKA